MSHIHHPAALRPTGLHVVLALAATAAAVVVLLLVIAGPASQPAGISSAQTTSRAGGWPEESDVAAALGPVLPAPVYRGRPDEGLAAVAAR
jgi:hypothetical protein